MTNEIMTQIKLRVCSHICGEALNGDKVRDHDHLTSKYDTHLFME